MDFSAALPTFVVTLREGFEASLVVGIVLACLKKVGQTQLNRWVYQGIGGGIVASILVGLLLGGILQGVNTYQSPYNPIIKECLATLFGIIAVAMLSWMLIWMTQQGKQLKGEVEQGIEAALSDENQAGKSIFLLVFVAVLREGFETVLFIVAKFENSWKIPGIGATLGLTTAAILGFLLFKLGIKINIRLFFKVMGIFLLLVVGGLVLGVLKHLNLVVMYLAQLEPNFSQWCWVPGDSCILGPLVWDGSNILPDKTFPGIILKSLFGYRQTLYLGQILVYLLFLLIVGTFYFKSLSSPTSPKSAEKVS